MLNALGGDTLTISLLHASAVAFDWQLWGTTPISIRLSNRDSFTPASVPFQPTFFGVTSTEPIRWIKIDHHRSVLNLDNFADAAAPVPEPQTLTLLGLGIAGMAAHRWRKRHPV